MKAMNQEHFRQRKCPPFSTLSSPSLHLEDGARQYNPDDLLEFICDQFISRMEDGFVAQRGKLISSDYKLINIKNHIGKFLSGRGTYCS